MSTCISSHGEFSEHELDDKHTCKLCHVPDEDAMRAELEQLRVWLDEYRATLARSEQDRQAAAKTLANVTAQRDEAIGRSNAFADQLLEAKAALADANDRAEAANNLHANAERLLGIARAELASVVRCTETYEGPFPREGHSHECKRAADGHTWHECRDCPARWRLAGATSQLSPTFSQELEQARGAVVKAAQSFAAIERDRAPAAEDSSIWLEAFWAARDAILAATAALAALESTPAGEIAESSVNDGASDEAAFRHAVDDAKQIIARVLTVPPAQVDVSTPDGPGQTELCPRPIRLGFGESEPCREPLKGGKCSRHGVVRVAAAAVTEPGEAL